MDKGPLTNGLFGRSMLDSYKLGPLFYDARDGPRLQHKARKQVLLVDVSEGKDVLRGKVLSRALRGEVRRYPEAS